MRVNELDQSTAQHCPPLPPLAKNGTALHWPPLATTAHPILCPEMSRKGFGKAAVDNFLSTSLSMNGLKIYEFLRVEVSRKAVGGSAYSPPVTAAETSPQRLRNVDFLLGYARARLGRLAVGKI